MAVAVETSHERLTDENGVPLSGALIYIYDVNSTTPKNVYSDKDLGVSAANPIETDAYGQHDIRYIATGSYKYVVKTSAGVTKRTRDNVDGGIPVGSGALAIVNGGTGAVTAEAALSNLGGASAAELAEVSAEVASISGSLASTEKTHIATGSTAQRPGTPVEGDIRRNTTTGNYEGADETGTFKYFITEENAASHVFTAASMPVGSVLQVVNTTSTAVATTTASIPYDDSIPQKTEGGEFMTLAITPKLSTSKLKIEVVFGYAVNQASSVTAALFQDSTANALAAHANYTGAAAESHQIVFTHYMTSGTTSSTTFKVNAGVSSSGTITFNGSAGARLFGGVFASSITITEIKA